MEEGGREAVVSRHINFLVLFTRPSLRPPSLQYQTPDRPTDHRTALPYSFTHSFSLGCEGDHFPGFSFSLVHSLRASACQQVEWAPRTLPEC